MSSNLFVRNLKRVTTAHLIVALAVVTAGIWTRWFQRKSEPILPVEFIVEVPVGESIHVEDPADKPPPPEPTPKPPEPTPPDPDPPPDSDIPEPTPPPDKVKIRPPETTVKPTPPKPDPKPEPKPKPKPTPIVPGRRVVRFGSERGTPTPRISEAEMRRLLAMGARAGDRTVVPGDDALGFAQIRNAFYDLWVQPSREEAGDATVRATITLAADGWITGRGLATPSGIRSLDDSVRLALNSVSRIEGLSRDFLARNRTVTIVFKVE